MDTLSTTPEAQLASTDAAPRSSAATATIWAELLDLWTGRAAERAEALPAAVAAAAGTTEVAARAYWAVFGIHQTVTDVIYRVVQRQQEAAYSVAQRQQDLVFATARTTALTTLEGTTAWVDGTPQRALAVYGEACSRAMDVARRFGVGALLGTSVTAKAQTEVATWR